jgi:hypothetical protein
MYEDLRKKVMGRILTEQETNGGTERALKTAKTGLSWSFRTDLYKITNL